MISLKNKKASSEEVMYDQIIFIVWCVLVFAIAFIYISWVGNTDRVLEEKYAKDIALRLSQMSPGMIAPINISELIDAANKNNYNTPEDRVILPINNSKVTVRVSKTGGYSFYSFSSIKPQITIDTLNKELIIKT
jgi:hypothetical protein